MNGWLDYPEHEPTKQDCYSREKPVVDMRDDFGNAGTAILTWNEQCQFAYFAVLTGGLQGPVTAWRFHRGNIAGGYGRRAHD